MYPLIFVIYLSFLKAYYADISTGSRCEKLKERTIKCNYIPEEIPAGIHNVEIVINIASTFAIRNTTFSSAEWSGVKRLDLRTITENISKEVIVNDGGFQGLRNMQELGLHVENYLNFSEFAFANLTYVRTLDMAESSRVNWENFLRALNGSDKLPGLNNLVLSAWNSYGSVPSLDDEFELVVRDKNIVSIDVSQSQVADVQTQVLSNLKHLEVFNMSYSTIDNIKDPNAHSIPGDLGHIKSIDYTHTIFPKSFGIFNVPGRLLFSNLILNGLTLTNIAFFLAPKTVNATRIIRQLTSVWVENCTYVILKDPQFYVQTLIFKQNSLKRFDFRLICEKFKLSNIKMLDLSDNEMEFLHPTFLSCIVNLVKLDLSRNELMKMVIENFTLAEKLLSGLKHLEVVILSRNKLHYIPTNFFIENIFIEVIDLSDNDLDQVTFTLHGLNRLKVLDLHSNKIHVLDSVSMKYLDVILHYNHSKTSIILKSNPLTCSDCASKAFLLWLLVTKIHDSSQNLTCLAENGKSNLINHGTIRMVQIICARKTIAKSTSISTLAIFLSIVTCIVIVHRRKKIKRKKRMRGIVAKNIREGEGQYQFTGFLVYSENDEEFVKAHILYQLNKHLQLLTGTDRNLVCMEDQDFRPGFYVHNETHRLLDASTVVVAVVSNNFCASQLCITTIEQATMDKKPVLQIFIEDVDIELLTPTMRKLCQRNVKFHFTIENGNCVLKTSWKNVCESLLDLIKCND